MKNKKITLILADDHPIFREGLKLLLTEEPNILIIGEAGDVPQLMSLLSTRLPDILVLDISMPGMSGIEAARLITAQYSCVAVLILSMHSDQEFIVNAIDAGARGFVPKDVSKDELMKAIRALASGGEYFSQSVSATVLRGMVRKRKTEQETIPLTQREREILSLAASGLVNKEIAEKLFISPRTVDCHKNHIMQKLALKSSAELILYAVKAGLVKL